MEYIKNIEIKNFKSIRHQTIDDCRRVNVFIGYPNVGKSNILEALGLFSLLQLGGRENFDLDQICRVKNFSELFFNQDRRQQIEITFDDKVSAEVNIDSYGVMDMGLYQKGDSRGDIDRLPINKMRKESGRRSTTIPNGPESSYRHLMAKIKKYEFISDMPVNAGGGFSLSVPNGSNLLEILQGNASLRKEITQIFEIYGLRLALDTADSSIKFFKELSDGAAVIIPYHQVADTLRRLIFFKTAIQTNHDSILLFEEPEAHMFPPYISKFTADVMYNKSQNQYFITTHSPFVLNDFMEDVDKEDLSVYAVGYKKETGETIIRRITEDEMEEIYQYGVDLFFNLENYLKDAV